MCILNQSSLSVIVHTNETKQKRMKKSISNSLEQFEEGLGTLEEELGGQEGFAFEEFLECLGFLEGQV